jgi:hypothetical protein
MNMSTAQLNEDEASASPGNKELLAEASDGSSRPQNLVRQQQRMQLAADYQGRALQTEDALLANLGSINGGLMRIAVCLDESIARMLERGGLAVEQLQTILPAVDIHLRVTRQIDRFAQLALRADSRQMPARNKLRKAR